MRHEIDDPDQSEALIHDQVFRQAPADADADYFILEIAEHKDALVISNDESDGYRDQYPRIDERRVPLMIVDAQVTVYESALGDDEEAIGVQKQTE